MAFREKAGKFGMYLLCAAGGAAALFLLLRYLLPAFAPFIFSFILALILQKPVNFLEKKCRVPRALSSALLMLLLLGLLCRGIAALLAVLIRESADFISELTSGDADYLAEISALADKIGGAVDRIIRDIFPAAEGVDTAGMMRSLFLSALSAAATTVSRWVAHTVSAMPRALVFFIVLVFSGIYFCADYPKIRAFVAGKLSGRLKKYSLHIRKEGIVAAAGYAKSYFVIFLLTFAELLLGFVIIRQKYAPMLAFVIATVDILPVLGVGTVLLPWTAGLLLGLEDDELGDDPPRVHLSASRQIREKYVCIASQASSQCKYWNNPSGWREVVAFLKEQGYRVLCIDRMPEYGSDYVWNHIPYGSTL